VRFCDEVTGTGELGIFHRGDHSEIGLFPGRDLTNNYAANVVDVCPVGALTDRDFRFQVRVWYLDTAKSICTGCARGCNIEVHTNRRRPHHAEGRRVARLKPRYNADVNAWWLCDVGRYHFGFVDERRLAVPARRGSGEVQEVGWDEAVSAVAEALRRHPADQVAVLASPQMANEDLMALRRLLEARGIRQVAFDVPPAAPAEGDDFLLRADRTPNRRGAELVGLGGDAAAILAAARGGRLRGSSSTRSSRSPRGRRVRAGSSRRCPSPATPARATPAGCSSTARRAPERGPRGAGPRGFPRSSGPPPPRA
jgi:NADH-quinone oxidoreductase subunit G